VAVVVVLALAGGVAAVVSVRHSARSNPGTPSVAAPVPSVAPTPRTRTQTFWPQYRHDPGRTGDAASPLRPPYRIAWVFRGGSLLEFPPAVAESRLYLPTFAGLLFALDPATGHVLWRYRSGRCAWGTPAVAEGLVFQTFLLRPPACLNDRGLDGVLAAFDTRSGTRRWQVQVPPTESSPLVAGGSVWIGDWSGAVSAFDARTGRRRWSYRTGGPVKASPTLAGGRIVVGSYDGRLYALDAATGKLAWRTDPRGTLYSTAAVAHGAAYVGSTDHRVYAFELGSGAQRWSFQTGAYVYSSPAVWRDLVLIGSYDGRLYAIDQTTGAARWSFDTGGPISGSIVVLGGVVYVSTLRETTFALDAGTGKRLWSFPDGKYTPVVADNQRLYLIGYNRLFGMLPR
jgi:outer membrane protein assembly factor BamB